MLFGHCFQMEVNSVTDTLGSGMRKASELPIQLQDDLALCLGSASICRDDILGSPIVVMPHFPGGGSYSLLGGSDGVVTSPSTMPKLL